jgi:uncharacterized protein YebE (UPF0316 family)
LGFSVGTLLGMWLDERMAIGYSTVQVIDRVTKNSQI